MFWLCSIFVAGIILSIGWRVGELIFEHLYSFITDAPYGIRRIRRYQKRKKNRINYYYDYKERKRS